MPVVVWGIISDVKSDADLEDDICKRTFQRFWIVLVGFSVVFRKIFIFFRLSRVGYHARG